MKLYDIHTDEFITERSAIIDALVKHAGRVLSYTERNTGPRDYALALPPQAKAVLSKALHQPEYGVGPRYAVKSLVLDGWRANVTA